MKEKMEDKHVYAWLFMLTLCWLFWLQFSFTSQRYIDSWSDNKETFLMHSLFLSLSLSLFPAKLLFSCCRGGLLFWSIPFVVGQVLQILLPSNSYTCIQTKLTHNTWQNHYSLLSTWNGIELDYTLWFLILVGDIIHTTTSKKEPWE